MAAKFEVGKAYKVNDISGSEIIVTKRTENFISFSGCYTGKRKVYTGLLGMGEYIMLPSSVPGTKVFCFAGHGSG